MDLQIDSSAFVQLETYRGFSCALRKNGSVLCLGANDEGQLGLGDTKNRGQSLDDLGAYLKPVNLSLPAVMLTPGPMAYSVYAMLINHEIKCWGNGQNGALGYEDEASRGGKENDMGDNLPFVRYK